MWHDVKRGVTTKSYASFGVIHGWWRTWFLGGVCYEKLKSATIALIFPCHQHNAREMWAKYSLQPRPWITTDLDLKKKYLKLRHSQRFFSDATASLTRRSGCSNGPRNRFDFSLSSAQCA